MAEKKKISAVVGRLKGETKTTVQTIIFSPKSAWTLQECKDWLKDHDLKSSDADETESSYRFRQRDPGDFKEGSFRTIAFKGGKKCVEAALVKDDSEKFTQEEVDYTSTSPHTETMCTDCVYFQAMKSCQIVRGTIAPEGWCKEWEEKEKEGKVKPTPLRKFIPFAKVDAAKREVWGIVTAEVPDKDDEVCDYAKTKPFYEAVIAEMQKATDGKNLFPLRYMHQLDAVGKGIGFEFRDDAKEIFMGFKVVDDDAWTKVEEGVLTGFSQGGKVVGDKTPDPVYKNCMRYVADPSECSLVDNPCLGVAHFAYVKSDGQIEMRKFKNIEESVTVPIGRLDKIIEMRINDFVEHTMNKMADLKKTPQQNTKRVGEEELKSDCFLVVGDVEKPETWKLPVKFSADAKTKRNVRAAIAWFPRKLAGAEDKEKTWKRLVSIAKENGIDVAEEQSRIKAVQDCLRKAARTAVNRHARTKGDPGHTLAFLDDNLGRLSKGLHEAGHLACFIQELGWMFYGCLNEEQWEGDDDMAVPEMLESNVNDLLNTLAAMVAHESDELREDMAARIGRT